MIGAAIKLAETAGVSNCAFQVEDCSNFSIHARSTILNGTWDKVFSNAALHWIMRQEESRRSVLEGAYVALKPGGKFVFECGGFGNVSEVVTAVIATIKARGMPIDKARAMIPWYFASTEWMEATLRDIGFDVDKIELESRPTRLNPDESGKGGFERWLRFFGASFLDEMEDSEKAVQEIVEILDTVVTKEDGSQWLGYVRLRGIATRPE